MSANFDERLGYDGDLGAVVARMAKRYGLGEVVGSELLAVGFEDYNVKVTTGNGVFVAKFLSHKRDAAEQQRYAEILQHVCDAGIRHPRLHKTTDGNALFRDEELGLSAVVMDYIAGKSFYDLGVPPTDEQLAQIIAEAVKINSLDHKPSYLFDSWAIPNIVWMFDRTKDALSDEGRELAEAAKNRYEAIPLDRLSKCFVHGDIIKSNAILGDDGQLYIIDFACANTYPRVQEIAVMAANLMFDEKQASGTSLRERVKKVMEQYLLAGGQLNAADRAHVFDYAVAAAAMEYMGSVNERLKGDDSEEIDYWERLGLEGLRQALRA